MLLIWQKVKGFLNYVIFLFFLSEIWILETHNFIVKYCLKIGYTIVGQCIQYFNQTKGKFVHSIPLVNRGICKLTMFKHYTNYFWIEYVVFLNQHFNQKSHIPISNIIPLSWRNLKNKILECIHVYRKRRERYKSNWTFQFKSYC